ncbi:MAG TPA: helix-hairpin-helix domain-containing protein, partial [Gemmatimonadales bacterium]|nr:helix-hairpin-helix domain-containing protein [Gemmatimonadales bacterium]
LLLAGLALAGAAVRLVLSPSPSRAPGDVRLRFGDSPSTTALQEAARRSAELSRPLSPGEKIDVDRADVIALTRLPHVGPALAQRIVAWREQHGAFGNMGRLDSVAGIGPKLLDALRPYVTFSGAPP